jgi:uncharacterized protein YndB with AHSA1/START domain
MAKTQTLEFKRTIHVPAAEVFLALTNATALREWFCDKADIDLRKGGRVYFAWHQGYYAAGEISKVVPNKKLAFSWTGRGEPDTTQVEITLSAKKDVTAIRVRHAGVPAGKKWKQVAADIARGWERGLENLQSVLETGQDQRFTLRPILGVTGLSDVTPELAEQLNITTGYGVKIDDVVAGLGAAAAGLQKDDVLTAIDEHKFTSGSKLIGILQNYRAGDEVAVTHFRGGQKAQAKMTLSARPLAAVPATAAELAEAVRQMYAGTDAELDAALRGVSDSEAASSPAPGEWSASEILAHLVINERDGHAWLAALLAGDEPSYSLGGGNSQTRTQATARVYGAAALAEELKANEAETVAMLAALPDDFVSRRRSYWRAANSALQTADHTRDHLRQMETALAAVRQPQ